MARYEPAKANVHVSFGGDMDPDKGLEIMKQLKKMGVQQRVYPDFAMPTAQAVKAPKKRRTAKRGGGKR
jgi:hypothetical protein